MPDRYRFLVTPRAWGLHVLLVLSIVAFGALSAWQWNRAHTRAVPVDPAPVALATLSAPATTFRSEALGRTVTLTGRFDQTERYAVVNRSVGGEPATWVVEILVTKDGSSVPVVRGWVPAGSSLPAAPTGQVTVVGRLQPPEDLTNFKPQGFDGSDGKLQGVATSQLVSLVDTPLHPGYVVASKESPSGTALARIPEAQIRQPSTGLRIQNAMYTFQWLIFAAFAVFVWWRLLREDWRDDNDAAGDDPEPKTQPKPDSIESSEVTT